MSGIDPVSISVSEPVIDHEPGWAEHAGAAGYPDAQTVTPVPADPREFVCMRCQHGQCARCNDRACTCCYGNEDP